jgi:elongation factor 1-beta
MGEVIIGFKLFPKSVETDLEQLKGEIGEGLPSGARISKSRVEPIAFGLNALLLDIVVPEQEALADKVEELIRSNINVENVEVLSQRRVLRL